MKKLLMLLALAPLMALADTWTDPNTGIQWTYVVKDGKAQVGSDSHAISTDTTGEITIPSELGDCPVTRIGSEAFRSCSKLTGVTIPEGVTRIGDRAFSWCRGLKSVTIPSSVTSIGGSAFYGCLGLRSVTVEASEPPTAEPTMLENCPKLRVIVVPKGTDKVYRKTAGWSSYARLISAYALSSAEIASITVGSAAVVGVAGHFIGRAVSEAIGKKKGHITYKQFKAMKLVVPELDAMGVTYKNRLIYHPAKGTLTGRIILEVQKGERTVKIRAKATGAYQEDGTFVGTLDAKGYDKHGFILGIADPESDGRHAPIVFPPKVTVR